MIYIIITTSLIETDYDTHPKSNNVFFNNHYFI